MERKRLEEEPPPVAPATHVERGSGLAVGPRPATAPPRPPKTIADRSTDRVAGDSQWLGRGAVIEMPRATASVVKRYGVALALSGLALLLRAYLPLQEGTSIYQLPLAAVALSAWYGGRGPGLFALLVSATGILYWFVPPANSFAIPADRALAFFIFIALGLLLNEFSAGRQRTERALRASEERFHALVQFSFDVYWETDAAHRFTRQEFSDRLTDAPARGTEIGKTRWEIPYVEPDEEAWRKHRATMDAHLPFRDFELARRNADGSLRYVSVSGIPAFDDQGRFVGYRGVGRHITERKRAEAEHRSYLEFLESMDRIHRVMHGAGDLEGLTRGVLDIVLEVFACDRAWLVYPCDPDARSARVVMERTRPEYPGAFALRRELDMTPATAQLVRAVLDSLGVVAAGAGHERNVEADIAEQFGVRAQMLMALAPKGDRPYLLGVHQCSRDRIWTSEEQRLFEEIGHRLADGIGSLVAFRSMRESEQRSEAAQRLAHVGWWERDLITSHVSLSDEVQRIFGVEPVDLPYWQDRWASLIHPDDRARTAAAAAAALSGGPRYDVEYRVVRPDGSVRVVRSEGDVIWDESGRAVRQFGVMQDVTERKRAEEALRAKDSALEMARAELARVSRLTTLGELTTSIAHEVSQPLGAMVASAGACTRWLSADPPAMAEARAALENIIADGKRARDVIARIRALTKRQPPRLELIDINRKILDMLDFTDQELRGHAIVVRTELESGLPPVLGDRVQLQQVLLNLIVNAIEAMSAVNDRPRELTIASARCADGVRVEVRDCGIGFDPERAEEVFEAFYTTKAEGIGIGLSISRSIVEAHGGRLWASANMPHGAVFQFSLPVPEASE